MVGRWQRNGRTEIDRRRLAVLGRMEGRRGGQPRRPPWGLAAFWGRRKLELGSLEEGRRRGFLVGPPKPAVVTGFGGWAPQAPAMAQRYRGRMMAGNGWMEGRRVSGQTPIDPPRACNVGSRPCRKLEFAAALPDFRHTHVSFGPHWGATKAPNRLSTGGKWWGPVLGTRYKRGPKAQAEAMSPAPIALFAGNLGQVVARLAGKTISLRALRTLLKQYKEGQDPSTMTVITIHFANCSPVACLIGNGCLGPVMAGPPLGGH
jgi:hypothetical protein